MKESKLNGKARDAIRAECPGAVVYKIADRFTAGIPDSVATWNGPTSWLEFKLLDATESIHDQLDRIQLVELVKLEKQSRRAWVIAYRKGNVLHEPCIEIYRPRLLLDLKVPEFAHCKSDAMFLHVLPTHAASFDGHDHRAVARLVKWTHSS